MPRYNNVSVSPDMYIFAPGSQRYIDTARGFLRGQLLFGTSFPLRPMRQSVQQFRTLGLPADTEARAMSDHLRRALGLS